MEDSPEFKDSNQIISHLKNLEARIARIEEELGIESSGKKEPEEPKILKRISESETEESLEFHIGQYWFAKFGIVVLAIGIAFLLTFPYKNLPPALPSIFGYFLVAAIFGLSYLLRKSYNLISRYMVGGAMVLLFFTTMRLHYFGNGSLIAGQALENVLLFAVVFINLFISIRRGSIYLAGVSLTLGYIAAIISGSAYFQFSMVVVLGIITVLLHKKYQWYNLMFVSIVLSYFSHLVWFINNPLLGNKPALVTEPASNIIFIILYLVIFAYGNIYRGEDLQEKNRVIVSTFLNSFGCYTLFLLITLTTFKAQLVISHISVSIVFLAIATIFWLREKSRFSTFFYAMLGYSALSVAIIAQFPQPDFFVWLSWQSILVISTAIWFRSKFIIVANFFIYCIIFMAYAILVEDIGITSLSFGVVALVSARILNWQKDRLELHTENMRNVYLFTAFVIFPYALYHLIPGGWLIVSWVGISIVYYALSLWLESSKYRWMALGNLLLTVIYVFIIGITKLEPVYRIISFLILGVVLLVVSLIYTKVRSKTINK